MSPLLLLKRVVHGSFGNLKPPERVILDALLVALPPDQARILAEQLSAIEIVQRTAGGRMVLPFYSKTNPPRTLAIESGEVCLARLQFTDGTHKANVRVQSYNGHFRSLEFSRAPKEFSTIRITAIAFYPNSKRHLADALDRLEHGTDNA